MRRGFLAVLCFLATCCFQPKLARAVVPERSSQLEGLLATLTPATERQVSSTQLAAAEAVQKEGVIVEWNWVLGTPQRLRGTNLLIALSTSTDKHLPASERTYQEKATAVLGCLAPLYDDNPNGLSFQPERTERDSLGFSHVRVRQTYRGVPVIGTQVIVHFDRSGRAYQINGEAIKDPGLDTNPRIAGEIAAEAAMRQLPPLESGPLRLVSQPALVVFALKHAPRLAYEIILVPMEETAGPVRWRAWIDAFDGTLILAYNDIHFVAPPSADGLHAQIKGNILPAEGGQAVSVTGWLESNGVYYLHNTNWSWQIYNLGNAGSDAATYAFRFDDTWGLSDTTEISAARNFDFTQRYFSLMHGRRSFDNAGIFAQANVHYSVDYANAFWSGAAFYFGDGNGTTAGSMAALDIAAHEFTHAVTDYSSQLIYANESGALNESFSDIFGVCVEFFAQADNRSMYPASVSGTAEWLIGEDCWLAAPALRDLRDPHNSATVGSQRQPSRYRGTFWHTGIGDNGGVHKNSGVQNFYFYLLSQGGAGTNDGIAYNVTGIGITNAAQIAFRALTVYCTPSTDYQAARGAWISAAQDLDTNWVASVADAWSAVGIGSMRIDPGSIVFRGPPGGPFSCLAPEVTLYNWGTVPLNWGLVSTQAWLQASPSTGSIPALGSLTVTFSTTTLAEELPVALYTNNLVFTNQSDASPLVSQARLYIGQPDHYTEVFDNNDLDLVFTSFTFTPDASSSVYSICREPTLEFPVDPGSGAVLSLGDDVFEQIALSGTNAIRIYGRTTNVFFIGSNGYLTMDRGDNSNLPTLANHFSRSRVAALLNDLNPAEGGTVSWIETSDRVAVTFQDVPVFGNPFLTNSFQIEMFYDGAIRITYLNVAFQNGLAGLSAGNGVPTAFAESHFSSYAACHPPLSLRAPVETFEGANVLIAQASVSIPFPVATNLFVHLTSSDTNEIWVPPATMILAGLTNVNFDLTIVDDARIDGTQNVTLLASVPSWTSGQSSVSVHDNESTKLELALPAMTAESSGVLTNAGIISISGTLLTNLVIEVLSDDPAALQVPLEATIPAGETSGQFDIALIDNPAATGPIPITITVSAAGFSAATNSITVADDETPPVPFGPSPTHLCQNVAQTNDLSWQSGGLVGQMITNYVYFGTNSVPGPAELLGFTTNSTWELPLLAPQTVYYWQVVAHHVGVTPGPVWQFTTRGVDHMQIVLITEFDPINSLLSLSLTNVLGSGLNETNVAVYRSTNMALPDWELLTNQLVLTNGVLRIENLNTRDLPEQFFRARQVP